MLTSANQFLLIDARSEAIGAVILQEGQSVAHGLRTLTECQCKYTQIQQELLVIVLKPAERYSGLVKHVITHGGGCI